jgi:hypothetical protein
MTIPGTRPLGEVLVEAHGKERAKAKLLAMVEGCPGAFRQEWVEAALQQIEAQP